VRLVELHALSAFSFQRGASEPEALVERAHALGYAGLALADVDGLYGMPRFQRAARALGLPALHGVTLGLACERLPGAGPAEDWGTPGTAPVVLLARTIDGWRSLCRLVSAARARDRRRPTTPLGTLLAEHAGLHALAGPSLPEPVVASLREAFGPGRVDLTIQDRLLKRDRRAQLLQRARAARLGLPLVVTGGVRFASPADRPLHDVLTCIRHGTTLERARTRLLPNAEFHLREPRRVARLFRHCPRALARTHQIAEQCTFRLDAVPYRFPPFEVGPGETPFSRLHRLVHEGACRRYRPITPAVVRQLTHELEVVERLELAGYFLVVHDIVRFCREREILCQGRGSAANSAVCYALGITAVDPVGMGLLFERFLSEERGEMPDVDLDIAHGRREEVIQYVYERYGREHATMVAEVVGYRARSALRDAGKAFGLDPARIDRMARAVERRHDADRGEVPELVGRAGGDDARRLALLGDVVRRMLGLPRHLSIHVGGMVVTGPPLTDLVPVEPAAMAGRTVVPWDKDDIDALGLIKIDLLGLGMLTVLDGAFRLVRAFGGRALALHTLPTDDPATWDMLCRADTVGVFQVESRAQMSCLPRLRPRRFYDLVVEVALIRPGPIQGRMVHPYLRRRAGREAVGYPHPSLAPILERTLGVPLFQEQGMRIAMEAAGFSAGEADELRRAMGHKRSHERMARLRARLVDGMASHGIDPAMARRIYEQLSAFADFGFPESHAASFALLAWASAWLKRHEPAAFLCALLNAQPMGFYGPATLVNDARRHGVPVLPVDVLASGWDSTLEWVAAEPPRGLAGPCRRAGVRLGLRTVRGLGAAHEASVRAALEGVATAGPFTDPEDFARRARLGRRETETLARLGALRGFETRRRQALWRVARMARVVPGPLARPAPGEPAVVFPEPSEDELVREDYAIGGISPDRHPMTSLRSRLARAGVVEARRLVARGPPLRRGPRVAVAGLVICRQRPQTAKGVTFLTLEDETGFANALVEPGRARACADALRAPLLVVAGPLERADGVVHVRAERLVPLRAGEDLDGLRWHDYR